MVSFGRGNAAHLVGRSGYLQRRKPLKLQQQRGGGEGERKQQSLPPRPSDSDGVSNREEGEVNGSCPSSEERLSGVHPAEQVRRRREQQQQQQTPQQRVHNGYGTQHRQHGRRHDGESGGTPPYAANERRKRRLVSSECCESELLEDTKKSFAATTMTRRTTKDLAALVLLALSVATLLPSFDLGVTVPGVGVSRLFRIGSRKLQVVDSFCYDNLLLNGDFSQGLEGWLGRGSAVMNATVDETTGEPMLVVSNRTNGGWGAQQTADVLGASLPCLLDPAGTGFYLRLTFKIHMYDEFTGLPNDQCDNFGEDNTQSRWNCPYFRVTTLKAGETRHHKFEVHDFNMVWDPLPGAWNELDVIWQAHPSQIGDDVLQLNFALQGGPSNSVMELKDVKLQRLEEADVPEGHVIFVDDEPVCTENTLVNGDGEYESPFEWFTYQHWVSEAQMEAVGPGHGGDGFAIIVYDRQGHYQGAYQSAKTPTECYGGSQYYIHFEAHVMLYDQATGAGVTTCDAHLGVLDCPFVAVRLHDSTDPSQLVNAKYMDQVMMTNWNPNDWNKLSVVVAFSPGFVETTWDRVRIGFVGGPPGSVIKLDDMSAKRIQYEDIPSGHEILDIHGYSTTSPIKTCSSVGDPHLYSFDRVKFDNHVEGWLRLYEYGSVKVEVRQTYLWKGGNPPAWNTGVRVTYGDRTYEWLDGDASTYPPHDDAYTEYYGGHKVVTVDPDVKIFFQESTYRTTAYNVWVSTSYIEGAEGACPNPDELVQQSLAMGPLTFPESSMTLEEAQDECADVALRGGLTEEHYDNCVVDMQAFSALDPTPNETLAFEQWMMDAAEADRLVFRETRADTYYRITGTEIEDPSIQGDPLIVGLNNQVFKFEGRSDAWYANLATDAIQWNMKFHKFESCPSEGNVFVTGVAIGVRENRKLTHSVVVKTKDDGSFFSGCDKKNGGVCLGDGSLEIVLDGETISTPGDYVSATSRGGMRVVAYNTFEACSRKWHDLINVDEDLEQRMSRKGMRHLQGQRPPVSFLKEAKGNSIDPAVCKQWIQERTDYDDLFSQPGGWSTVHIETPLASFHIEYRQNLDVQDGMCVSHSIDAWMSKVSPEMQAQEWRGILGETRARNDDKRGRLVLSDRKKVLSGERDEDYEVSGPYGTNFAAFKPKKWWQSSSLLQKNAHRYI